MKWSYIDPAYPLLVASAGVWVAWKWRSLPRGRWLIALSVGTLWLLSVPHGAWLLSLTVRENLASSPSAAKAGAIVALAGGVLPPTASLPTPLPLTDTVASAEKAAWVYLNRERLPVLLCGGTTDPESESTPYADAMTSILMQRGVPESDIWTERQSSSTYENAKFGAAILKLRGIQRIVLITHYLHYKRARLSFERQGIVVEPAAIGDFSMPPPTAMSLLPSVESLRLSQRVVHELGGLVAYRFTGKI
jgi:uncharacterized SAM-binding protein YcdF (DUF218 family)